jgi:hypothetical protein
MPPAISTGVGSPHLGAELGFPRRFFHGSPVHDPRSTHIEYRDRGPVSFYRYFLAKSYLQAVLAYSRIVEVIII